ncbi:MAG: putative 4-mercaptohistidine N1-methyltransferase [Opitutae bacterium]|jgi:putative 4-mercaptohistidine N1-methyltranferase|nr:putative 4-mercaptohistidine N1-methyltransferase [Opitutae bacterium]
MHTLYESDDLLNQYLLFHYATKEKLFPYDFPVSEALDFSKRCVLEGVDFDSLPSQSRALDLGCSVGRSAFEMSKHFNSVVGIDYSEAFINAANVLKNEGRHRVDRLISGHQSISEEVILDVKSRRDRVSFEVGDAENLREDLGDFDCVLACNLICRLPNPNVLLDRLSTLVRPNGQLFITTPFTWLESFTPKDHWLGINAEDSFSGLRKALEEHGKFKLLKSWDMPFLIREHARKFQFSIAQASRWVRLEG